MRGRAAIVREAARSVSGDAAPPEGGELLDPPVYVEVVGQLFLDSAHGVNDARGKKGMPAATLWETHPVLDLMGATPP